MGLRKKKGATAAPPVGPSGRLAKRPSGQYTTETPTAPGGVVLPGTCGYRAAKLSERHQMPPTRLTYVRPDGRRD